MDASAIAAEVARQMAGRPRPAPIEIDEADEGRAAGLFLALDTQWNWVAGPVINGVGGLPMRTGLRYEAIAAVAGATGIAVDAAVLRDLRTMEDAALAALAEARR